MRSFSSPILFPFQVLEEMQEPGRSENKTASYKPDFNRCTGSFNTAATRSPGMRLGSAEMGMLQHVPSQDIYRGSYHCLALHVVPHTGVVPASHLWILPRSCAGAVKEAAVPRVFCVLPAARMSAAILPFLGPRRPQPGRTRRGIKGIPSSAKTSETQENRAHGRLAGWRTARRPHGFAPMAVAETPSGHRAMRSSRSSPSPIPILRSGLGGAAGREGAASSHAVRAPLRGNKGGGRRARPRTPPPPASPASSAACPGAQTKKKKDTFFCKLCLAQTPFLKAFTLFLLPNAISPADFSAGVPTVPGQRRGASPCCNAGLSGETPSRIREFLWERWGKEKKKKAKKPTPHFYCRKKKIVWRNRKPGGPVGTRGGRKRRAFEWVFSPQCSSGCEFSLQGSGHEKDSERATKSLMIFFPLLKHNLLPDNQRFGGNLLKGYAEQTSNYTEVRVSFIPGI